MTRALVLWAEPAAPNLGVAALAEGAASIARDVWGADCEVVHQDFHSWALGEQLHRKSVLLDRVGVRRTWSRRLDEFDVVLDTGAGDSLADIYGLERLFVMTQVQQAVLNARVPLVLLPQTIGPFRTRVGRRLARRTLQGADVVAARDPVSLEYAHEVAGVIPTAATDLVFALPEAPASRDYDVLLNVSGLLWSENPHVDHRHYRALVRGLVRRVRDTGRTVHLVLHVLDNWSMDNDALAADALTSEIPDLPVLVPADLGDVRRMLASAQLVVGSRMHACLNALSVGTPAVSLAYSRKFSPLLADLGWHHGLDLRDKPDVDRVMAIVEDPSLTSSVHVVRADARDRIAELRVLLAGSRV